jgi:hypothetical protein
MTIEHFANESLIRNHFSLREFIEDENGMYQRWQRKEAPFYEMCRAVVLALVRDRENPEEQSE